MDILWLDINASYSHASLALPALHAQLTDECWKKGLTWHVVRGTVKSDYATLLNEVVGAQPDVILASVWLFTHHYIVPLLARIKALMPHATIVLGGPEFLGENETFLKQNPFVDAVLRGEGEELLPQWLPVYRLKEQWHTIQGLCYLHHQHYVDNGKAIVGNFSALRFPEESEFYVVDKHFVQVESARGCFNTCSFCSSGNDRPVRALSLDQIEMRLEHLHRLGVSQIRMLDRTFNGNLKRAVALLKLMRQFEGRLSFHIEVHPSLLNEELKRELAQMPAGILHVEAGIQSLQQHVLDACHRSGTVEQALKGLHFLFSLRKQLETHTDLIAGLPHYTYQALLSDTATLVMMQAGEIQLESLKLLPGTRMRNEAEALRLAYATHPPYEVLQTPAMSYVELQRAMVLSRLLDIYYNHSIWQSVLHLIVTHGLLAEMVEHFIQKQEQMHSIAQAECGKRLAAFLESYLPEAMGTLQEIWLRNGLLYQHLPHLIRVEPNPTFVEELEGDWSNRERSNIRCYKLYTPQAVWTVAYNRSENLNKPFVVKRDSVS